MPKISRKIPYATVDLNTSGFVIAAADWKRIERGYEQKLSPVLRTEILEATKNYIKGEKIEHNATPLAEAKKHIEAYKKSSENLRTLMLADGDASSYARLCVAQASRRLGENGLAYAGRALAILKKACDAALKELESEIPLESIWRLWIRALAEIMEENGLPTKVRKDVGNKSNSDRQSPFARFVWELQKCLPADCSVPYAESALPTAIWGAMREARSGSKRPRAEPE